MPKMENEITNYTRFSSDAYFNKCVSIFMNFKNILCQ